MENVHIVKFVSLSVRPNKALYHYLIKCFDEEKGRYVEYSYCSSNLFTWIRVNQYLRVKVGPPQDDLIFGLARFHALKVTPIPNDGGLTEEQMTTIGQFQQWLMFQDE